MVAGRPDDHVRLGSRRQLRDLRDGSPTAGTMRRLTSHPRTRRVRLVVARWPGIVVHVGPRAAASMSSRCRRGSAAPARVTQTGIDVVSRLLAGWIDARVPRRPRRPHDGRDGRRASPADDGSGKRHVSVVVARRQAARVHDLAQRPHRDLHDERGRDRSEEADDVGAGDAIDPRWSPDGVRSRSCTCRTA